MTSNWDDKWQVQWLDSVNVPLVRGHARFTGPKKVAVTNKDGVTSELEANVALWLPLAAYRFCRQYRASIAASHGTTAISPLSRRFPNAC